MSRLEGERIVVTGGASGIGLAIATALSDEGARVIVLDRDPDAGGRVAAEHSLAGFVEGDVTDAGSVARAVEEAAGLHGGIDGLVNNAGIEILGGIDDLTEEQWDRQFDVNVKGVFLVTKAALPHLLESAPAAVVNTASDVGLNGEIGIDAYVASKHAVVGLTRSLALTWARRGIRFNAICPGTTLTPLTERHFAAAGGDEQSASRSIPAGRLARPAEIASGVAFLLSDEAGYVNGSTLVVDGGATAGPFSVDALDSRHHG